MGVAKRRSYLSSFQRHVPWGLVVLGCISEWDVSCIPVKIRLKILLFYWGCKRENPSFEILHYSNIPHISLKSNLSSDLKQEGKPLRRQKRRTWHLLRTLQLGSFSRKLFSSWRTTWFSTSCRRLPRTTVWSIPVCKSLISSIFWKFVD